MNQDQNQSDPQKPEKQEDQAVPSTEELATNDTQEQVQAESENTNTEPKSKAIKLIGGTRSHHSIHRDCFWTVEGLSTENG